MEKELIFNYEVKDVKKEIKISNETLDKVWNFFKNKKGLNTTIVNSDRPIASGSPEEELATPTGKKSPAPLEGENIVKIDVTYTGSDGNNPNNYKVGEEITIIATFDKVLKNDPFIDISYNGGVVARDIEANRDDNDKVKKYIFVPQKAGPHSVQFKEITGKDDNVLLARFESGKDLFTVRMSKKQLQEILLDVKLSLRNIESSLETIKTPLDKTVNAAKKATAVEEGATTEEAKKQAEKATNNKQKAEDAERRAVKASAKVKLMVQDLEAELAKESIDELSMRFNNYMDDARGHEEAALAAASAALAAAEEAEAAAKAAKEAEAAAKAAKEADAKKALEALEAAKQKAEAAKQKAEEELENIKKKLPSDINDPLQNPEYKNKANEVKEAKVAEADAKKALEAAKAAEALEAAKTERQNVLESLTGEDRIKPLMDSRYKQADDKVKNAEAAEALEAAKTERQNVLESLTGEDRIKPLMDSRYKQADDKVKNAEAAVKKLKGGGSRQFSFKNKKKKGGRRKHGRHGYSLKRKGSKKKSRRDSRRK